MPNSEHRLSEIILRIRGPMAKNVTDLLVVPVANGQPVFFIDNEVQLLTSPIDDFRDEIIHFLLQHGAARFFSRVQLFEAIIGPHSGRPAAYNYLECYLGQLPVDDELIIIDPYFMPACEEANAAAYASTVADILRPFATILRTVHIIVGAGGKRSHVVEKAVLQAISQLSALPIAVHVQQSNDFHDRFWISAGRQRGILSGTSLNGYGRKYAVIDHLDSSDTADHRRRAYLL